MRYLFFISLFLLTSCSTFMEDCFPLPLEEKCFEHKQTIIIKTEKA